MTSVVFILTESILRLAATNSQDLLLYHTDYIVVCCLVKVLGDLVF